MPQLYYPRANTSAQRFDDDFPGTTFTYPLKRVVWHTTETNGWPGYSSGASAPTLTVLADAASQSVQWRQHFPANMSARALRNLSGGVETNRDECVQVEIVGTCDPARHAASPSWLYAPDPPNVLIEAMAEFSAWCLTEWGIPLDCMPVWQSYPGSYGATSNRMTNAEWTSFRGHCGHQHVPENTHGDPGRIPMRSVMIAGDLIAHPTVPPPTSAPDLSQEDDMFICHSTDGRQWLVHGLAKTYLPTMAVVNELKLCGVKDQGERSAAMLGVFATVEVGDVGGLYQFGSERAVETITAVGNVKAVVDQILAEVTPEPTPPTA